MSGGSSFPGISGYSGRCDRLPPGLMPRVAGRFGNAPGFHEAGALGTDSFCEDDGRCALQRFPEDIVYEDVVVFARVGDLLPGVFQSRGHVVLGGPGEYSRREFFHGWREEENGDRLRVLRPELAVSLVVHLYDAVASTGQYVGWRGVVVIVVDPFVFEDSTFVPKIFEAFGGYEPVVDTVDLALPGFAGRLGYNPVHIGKIIE